MELESIIHKLTLSSTHDLALASARLLERIRRLNVLSKPRKMPNAIDTPQFSATSHFHMSAKQQSKATSAVGAKGGNPSLIERGIADELKWYRLAGIEELSLSLSLQLIHLFLPNRAHYSLFINLPRFLHRASLPSSDPGSIHPCLLNVCHLCACTSDNGLASFQPYFLQRTRYHLQQSLMFSDRITDFLWASIVLGCFYGRERRLAECAAIVGSTTRFAIACGLDLPSNYMKGMHNSYVPQQLLPPPKDEIDADDRLLLAHSIYVWSHALPFICGFYPALFHDGRRIPDSQNTSIGTQDDSPDSGDEKWRPNLDVKVLVVRIFERVNRLGLSIAANDFRGLEEEYSAIEAQIHLQYAMFYPKAEANEMGHRVTSTSSKPRIFPACATLFGSELLLHSFRAKDEAASRRKLLECVQSLVDICDNAEGSRDIHLGLVNAMHMMNSVRVIARELQGSKVRQTAGLSINYCRSIELLLDFVDDSISVFPAWADAPVSLMDTLTAAVNSLSTKQPAH
ncbi:hypothetical protein DL93DRAFT_2086164 [Clavulina sp. PMI_390]|nr:hypothetical protein DL93DRAFT_2086164 [Clavulina sp. PMI_390]